MKVYFTADGTFGYANDGDIAVVDVANWTNAMLMDIEECSDSERMALALHFSRGNHNFIPRGETRVVCDYCFSTPEQLGLA